MKGKTDDKTNRGKSTKLPTEATRRSRPKASHLDTDDRSGKASNNRSSKAGRSKNVPVARKASAARPKSANTGKAVRKPNQVVIKPLSTLSRQAALRRTKPVFDAQAVVIAVLGAVIIGMLIQILHHQWQCTVAFALGCVYVLVMARMVKS